MIVIHWIIQKVDDNHSYLPIHDIRLILAAVYVSVPEGRDNMLQHTVGCSEQRKCLRFQEVLTHAMDKVYYSTITPDVKSR